MVESCAVVDSGNTIAHWDARRTAKHIKARQDSGQEARLLITGGVPAEHCNKSVLSNSKKRPVAPKVKNFQQRNRKTIKEIQQKNEQECEAQRSKVEQEKQQRERVKPKELANVSSRIFGEGKMVPKISAPPRRVSLSSSDGGVDVSADSCVSSVTSPTNAASSPRNFVQENKSVAPRPNRSVTTEPNKEEQTQRHSSYGKIPTYILNRKAVQAEAERLLQLENENKCPEGMVLMSESDRLDTLRQLKEKEESVQYQLMRLPIANRTMASEAKRERLEKESREIEQAQDMFSRDKVYVMENAL